MSFTALSSAWLLLLLPPLIAFYFLKLKRPRVVIPSLVLWRQVLEDRRVNSPFQKFKRNLLLLLQILILCALIFAAMQPVIRGSDSASGRLPILIDVSASMGAKDAAGVSRLDEAKQHVRKLIDSLPRDREVSLIAFSANARRVAPFTNSRSQLRAALDGLKPEDVGGSLDDALRLAQSMARSTSFDRVLVVTDSNFPPRANIELSFKLDFHQVGEASPNYGITGFSANRMLSPTGAQWEILVQAEASEQAGATTGVVELIESGRLIGREELSLLRGAVQRCLFRLPAEGALTLQARLSVNVSDSLVADNSAWLALPPSRDLRVYVASSLGSIRHALRGFAGLVLNDENTPSPGVFDLAFTDSVDTDVPARVLCSVNAVPADLLNRVVVRDQSVVAIDWRRNSPVLDHVVFDDVVFQQSPESQAGLEEGTLGDMGYEILVHGPKGPILLSRRESENVRFHWLVQLDRSTFPYRVGFPVFISNMVQFTMRETRMAEIESHATGILRGVTLDAGKTYRMSGPNGVTQETLADANGRIVGVSAPFAGLYQFREMPGLGGSALELGASVLNRAETRLQRADTVEFNDALKVTIAGEPIRTDRALWWPITALALAILVLEWWLFQARPLRV